MADVRSSVIGYCDLFLSDIERDGMIIISKNIDNKQSCEANARRKSRKEWGSIEKQIRHEAEGRRIARRQVDVISGLTKSSGPQRGDYKICKEANKILSDYKQYKGLGSRKKIENEYFQMQAEARRNNYKV